MRVDELKNKAIAKYEKTAKVLLTKNTELINTRKPPIYIKLIQFKRNRSMVPFIEASSKSNFLAITPLNLFTKDEPILRYVPKTQSEKPTSITWFDGATFGNKSFDSDDMIDLIFEKMNGTDQKRKNEFTQVDENVRNALKLNTDLSATGWDNFFCSVCLIFGCRIHKLHNPKILKHNEKRECTCNTVSKATRVLLPEEISISKNTLLTGCVISKLLSIKNKIKLQCLPNTKCNLKPKKVACSKLNSDVKQFYEPCDNHRSCADKACECIHNGTVCESFCGCQLCSNSIFCSCKDKICEKDCPCRKADRECTDLCNCMARHGKNFCANMPVLQGIQVKTSVGKSSRHGLGLFTEEFIKASSYVIEYTGELITDKEAERRGNFYEMNKLSYLFNAVMRGNECLYSIDAFFLGNKSRFINHSVADANISSKILVSHGNIKVVFYSLREIYKGEELLFDYKFTTEHKTKHGIID